jgi:hypothetical protein
MIAMSMNDGNDTLDTLNDAQAAAAFRRLVRHLRKRHDAQNIDLMGLAGFCRNCLADWVAEASAAQGKPLGREEARRAIYGMDYVQWKAAQPEATAEQIARMEESVARNAGT